MSMELLIGMFFCYVVPSPPAASAYGGREKNVLSISFPEIFSWISAIVTSGNGGGGYLSRAKITPQ